MSDDTDDTAPDSTVHENTLLASAYLDDEATADERVLVETSQEALGDVDAFSQLRTVLAATAPTSSLSEREAHLAGALDVWERMTDLERSGEATPAAGVDAAAAAAVLTPTSTSQGRRARKGRGTSKRSGSVGASQWLLGAAAALVVVAGGAAVVRGILAEDASIDQVAVESADADSPELSELEAAEAAEVEGRNVGTDVVVDADAVADEAQADPDGGGGLFPGDDATEEATEEAGADGDAGESAPAEQPAPAAEIDRVDLQTTDDLADYGSLVIRAISGVSVPTTNFDAEPPGESCEAKFDIQERLEPARYQGEDVFVGVDVDRGIVYAYTEDCTLVESVPLPPPPTQP